MICTGNEHIPLLFDCSTKGATFSRNRKPDFDDYVDLYHDEDPLFTEEQYTFYVSSI